jgi:copper chaperone CopZ
MGGHQVTGTTSMAENIQEIIFEVEGIICTGCAMDMETVMLNIDGIEEASVNYADGTFTIQYDADEIDVRNVFEKVKKLGFKTKILLRGA